MGEGVGQSGASAMASGGGGDFHSSSYQAAKIALLMEPEKRLGLDEWKEKKEEDARARMDDAEAQMEAYKRELERDRERRLARGVNHRDLAEKQKEKDRERERRHRKEKKHRSVNNDE